MKFFMKQKSFGDDVKCNCELFHMKECEMGCVFSVMWNCWCKCFFTNWDGVSMYACGLCELYLHCDMTSASWNLSWMLHMRWWFYSFVMNHCGVIYLWFMQNLINDNLIPNFHAKIIPPRNSSSFTFSFYRIALKRLSFCFASHPYSPCTLALPIAMLRGETMIFRPFLLHHFLLALMLN